MSFQNARLRKLLLLSPLLATFACVSPAGDTETGEDDIRKRVNPNSGTAAFELKKPAWHTDAFQSLFQFDGVNAEWGKRYERNAGSFVLRSGVLYAPSNYGFGVRGASMTMNVPLELGVISVYQPAGFVLKYDRPVTAGQNNVLAARGNERGIYIANDELRQKPEGYSVIMLDGRYELETSAEAKKTIDVAEGQKKEIVLPTAKVDLRFETIDAEFPGTITCLTGQVRGENRNVGATAENLSVARDRNLVVPAGSLASLSLDACGERQVHPLTPGAEIAVTVHRLEVNDLDIVDPTGEHRMVKGRFDVERKRADGTFVTVVSNNATHTGVDVTDGTYRIVSTAPNAPPHVQEITFP